MSLVVHPTLTDGCRGVVCVAGGECRLTGGEEVVIEVEGGVGREFVMGVWKGKKLVEEIEVRGSEVGGATVKEGKKAAMRWVLEGVDTATPPAQLREEDLGRVMRPPLVYNGVCQATFTHTGPPSMLTLTTPGPLVATKALRRPIEYTFPLLTEEDVLIATLPHHPPLLIKLDPRKPTKTYSFKSGVWKSPADPSSPALTITTDATLRPPPKVPPNTVLILSGRFPPAPASQYSVNGIPGTQGDWPHWSPPAKLEATPGGTITITKNGTPFGKLTLPHGAGSGWVGADDGEGHAPRGWPAYEVYIVYNFPEAAPSTYSVDIRAVRSRKLLAADGAAPQAVACGIVCLDKIYRLDAVTPTSGVWTWGSGTVITSISTNDIPTTVGLSMLEDVEGLPLGTGRFELTEKKLKDAETKDMRLSIELANEQGDPAGSSEVVIRAKKSTKTKKKAKHGTAVKPAQKKAGVARGAKATLLVGVQQLRGAGTGATMARVKLGTRQPETKELNIPSHSVFSLTRLRELVNIKLLPPTATSTATAGQISFLVEPLISEGCFKSASGEGWVHLQPDPGPYYDHVAPSHLGEAYVRWSLEVKQTVYYELPTGRDMENHLKWPQVVQKNAAPRPPVRRTSTSLPPVGINLKVKQIKLNDGALGQDFKVIEMGANKYIPLGRKMKLAVKSEELQLNVSCGRQAVGVCTVPLTTPCEDRFPLTRYGTPVGNVLLRWDKASGVVLEAAPPVAEMSGPQISPSAGVGIGTGTSLGAEQADYVTSRSETMLVPPEPTGHVLPSGFEELEFELVEERGRRETAEQNELYYKAAADEAEGRMHKIDERNTALQSELRIMSDRYKEVMVGGQQPRVDDLVHTVDAQERELEALRTESARSADLQYEVETLREEARNTARVVDDQTRELAALRAAASGARYTERDMEVANFEVRDMARTIKEQERDLAALRAQSTQQTERDIGTLRTVKEQERDLEVLRAGREDMMDTVKEQERQLAALRATNSSLEATIRDLRRAAAHSPQISRDVLHSTLRQTSALEHDLQEANSREQSLRAYIDMLRSDLASSMSLLRETARELP